MDKAFVFDFDDTLAKTKCKIRVRRRGKKKVIRKITPEEFNSYELKDSEYFDFGEFRSSKFIRSAKPLELLELAKEVCEESHSVYILTAREDDVSDAITAWLKAHGVEPKTVYCVGGDKVSISKNKRKVLLSIMKSYDKIYFYDDSPDNINSAPSGKKIKKYKV